MISTVWCYLDKDGQISDCPEPVNKFPRQACVYHVCKDSSNARLCLVAFVHFVGLLLQGQKVLQCQTLG